MSGTANASLVWSIAELLRGDYKQADYGKVVLPFTLLRRLDCVLAPTKAKVLETSTKQKDSGLEPDFFLRRASGYSFYNTSPMDFQKLLGDPNNIRRNLGAYVNSFSPNVRDIFEKYEFEKQLEKLDGANLLFQIVQKYAALDLSPTALSNADMGLMFEELIRRFAELSNETAGEHYTPREVIRLMVDLLFNPDDDVLSKPGVVRSLYDPTAGTGGMLSIAEEYLKLLNPQAKLRVFGQELNDESYAICKADMLIKGHEVENIVRGNTLSDDAHRAQKFDYMLSNPPFGVEWKKVETAVKKEHEQKGFDGRFGPGLPRVSDGSLLFLMHLLSKMRPVSDGGSRIAIVLNGSPLFTGGAGSGESNIRKWVIENDFLEAIIALPTDMFYNTGIATYIWLLTNHKAPERRGKIQLINATEFYQKMRKSLGSKRKELSLEHIKTIVQLYGAFEENQNSKIFDGLEFGYSTITVERPLREAVAVPESFEDLRPFFEIAHKNLEFGMEEIMQSLVALDTLRGQTFLTKKAFIQALKNSAQSTSTKVLQNIQEYVERGYAEQGYTLVPSGEAPRLAPIPERIISAWGNYLSKPHPDGEVVQKKGKSVPDASLRDTENVPLTQNIQTYFEREVLPHVPDAWIDPSKTKVGYEIPFTRHFYQYTPPRPLEEIDADLKQLTSEISTLLAEITA